MPLGIVWPQDQLTLLYHMENANDSSGNECYLTNSYAGFTRSKFGQGAVFDGINDRLYENNPVYSYLDPEEDTFTMMFWLKMNTKPANNRSIWTTQTVASTITCYYDQTSDRYKLVVGTRTVSFSTSPVVGEWHHVAFSVGSNIVLYWDGAVAATASLGSSGGGGTEGAFVFGQRLLNALYCTMDEAVVFDDVKTPQWMRKYYAWATGKL